jgi:hypothetical protein|tara:strand:- start:661 stop:960 length:300 start_codon:yes stop_codon:yes gene_type:complete
MTNLYIFIFLTLIVVLMCNTPIYETFKNKGTLISKRQTFVRKCKDFVLTPITYPHRIIKKRFQDARDFVYSNGYKISKKVGIRSHKIRKNVKYWVNYHL